MHAAAAHVCMCMWWKNMLACGIFQGRKKNIAAKELNKRQCMQRKKIFACMHAGVIFFFL
jgi:hypothetical protein